MTPLAICVRKATQSSVPFVLRTAKVSFRTALKGDCMRRGDHRIAHYGRLGLVVAAFALVAGIVAAPLLQSIWPPALTVAER
jgi:hypothetical protein